MVLASISGVTALITSMFDTIDAGSRSSVCERSADVVAIC